MRFLKKILVLAAALLLAASSYVWAAGLNALRTSSTVERDRLVFDFTEMPIYHIGLSGDGRVLTFDFMDTNATAFQRTAVHTQRIDSVSYAARNGHFYVTVTMAQGMKYALGNLMNPARIFLDVAPAGADKKTKEPAAANPSAGQTKPSTPPYSTAAPTENKVPALPILKEEQIAAGLMQRTYI